MTKKLSRRTLLRGAGGVAISLPFLEAMLERNRSVAQVGAIPKRVIFFFTSCGVVPDTWWPTSGGERDFVLNRAHRALEPLRDKILLPDGVRMDTATNDSVGRNGHDKGTAHCLTATNVVEGPSGVGEFGHLWDGTAGGISIDQHIANYLEGETPYRSLEFGVRAEGIRQALPSRISYRGEGEAVIPRHDPAVAFDQIFAPLAGGVDAAAARQRRRELVLSAVRGDLGRLEGRLGYEDRLRIQAHTASIEELERQLGDLAGAGACTVPTRPGGIGDRDYPLIGRAQMDLIVHSLKCDLTRVASIQWSTGQSGIRMDWAGHAASHHGISHEVGDLPTDWDAGKNWRQAATEIDTWYAEQYAYLLTSLDAIDAGDGTTLLDNTVVVWVNEQEQDIDNTHRWTRMPYILGGSCGGYFDVGRYVNVDARHGEVFVDVMKAMGMPDDTFGDPTHCDGPVSGLT
ncbi:MAG: hypothetical protein DRJ42_00215 [Deltaproteobacteria bacterium]|nr:MAG: hypothetical protein DRJ42_00215 [Deltaproteobacteria bacterium]